MIRILMLDLGETLVSGNRVLPGVVESLGILSDFETEDGDPLELSLVSDFHLAASPQELDARVGEFTGLLESFGLRAFFEPLSRRVTLSTHLGFFKPDRRVFEEAIARLGLAAQLSEALFVTENRAHVAACRGHGMSTLLFRAEGSADADFSDWALGSLLISDLVASGSRTNLEKALALYLRLRHGIEDVKVTTVAPSRIEARGRQWTVIEDPRLGPVSGVEVQLPAQVGLVLGGGRTVDNVRVQPPPADHLEEIIASLQTLLANDQISLTPGRLKPGATHEIETTPAGRKRLKRRRFSSI